MYCEFGSASGIENWVPAKVSIATPSRISIMLHPWSFQVDGDFVCLLADRGSDWCLFIAAGNVIVCARAPLYHVL